MPDILAETYFTRHVVTAVVSVVLAAVLAVAVDRAIGRAVARARRRVGDVDPGVSTRLRFLRRVAEAAIVVLGVAVALAQFTALDRLAASLLASGAIAAAVVGFAARQTLANMVAGLLLAVTQPLRIGDVVTFEGQTGVVEDVRLTATYLRTAGEARVIVPNELLAGSVLRNDTLVTPTVAAEASVWIGRDDDAEAALAALAGMHPRVAEVTADGVRIGVSRPGVAPLERGGAEADLRREALAALRRAAGEGPAAQG
jgi:small-conductance mechanosensitive channel